VAQEVLGIVDVQHGEGAVVLRPRSEQQVLAALRARQRRLPEIVEAHEALEVKLAELAARRRGEEDLARIDDALAYMEARCGTEAWARSATSASHAAVTAAARSGLLADLLAEISNTIYGSRVEWLSQPGHPQTRCTVTGRSRTPSRRHQQDADPGWPVPSRSSACRLLRSVRPASRLSTTAEN
jgi:GntR family transcriptional repressor for pyruvate dehydrogenase complex